MDIERIIIDAQESAISYALLVLKQYIEEAQSYGDELDIDTFYDQFEEYLMKAKEDMEKS